MNLVKSFFKNWLFQIRLFFAIGILTWIPSCGGVHLNHPVSPAVPPTPPMKTVLTVGASSSNSNELIARGLNSPNRVVSDGTHLFIADTGNHRVLIYNHIPISGLAEPDVVLGQPNLSTNTLSSSVSASTLNSPRAICVSGSQLFVADTSNNRVLVWNSIPTQMGQSADLVLGQSSMTSNTASVSQTPLDTPFDLACNSKYLWVLDNSKEIFTFTLHGLSTNATADIVLAPSGTPTAIAVDSGHFILSTYSNVQIWTQNTETSAPSSNTPTTTLKATLGINALYSDGTHIWISTSNNQVVTYTGYSGTSIVLGNNTGLTLGEATPTSNAGGTSGTLINQSKGISGDGKYLYVADAGNHRVLIYDLPSVPSSPTAYTTPAIAAVGQGALNLGSANSPIGPQVLYKPSHGISDGTHLIVADTGNNRVLIWNSVPTVSGTSADLVLGQGGDFYSRVTGSDASSGNQSYLSNPTSVFSDGTHLFVADSSNHRVLVWNTFPTSSTTPPTFAIGQTDLTSVSSGTSNTTLNSVNGVYADSNYLFIADSGNKRLLIYPLTTLLSAGTSGQAASWVLGASDLSSVGAGTGSSGFVPFHIYSTGTQLWITDSANNRTLGWKEIPTSNSVAPDFILGQTGSTPSSSTMSAPQGITIWEDKLYIADSQNDRVLIWNTIPNSSSINAESVFGQDTLTSSATTSSQINYATLNNPNGLSSYKNLLIITDTNNNRILFEPQ